MVKTIVILLISICFFLTTPAAILAQEHKTCAEVDTGGKTCVPLYVCGILDQVNTYYLLMDDVHSEATCFWFSGDDITLDLNQYTVYYDELDIPEIPYRDFEIENNDISVLTAAGWDLSGAPGAEIVEELKSITSRTLHLPASGGSVVLSPPFRIPKADYTFVASTFLNGLTPEDDHQKMIIDFINAETGEPYEPGIGLPARPARDNEIDKDGAKELVGLVVSLKTEDTPLVRIRIRTYGPMLIDYVDFRGFLHPAIASQFDMNPAWQYFATDDMPEGVIDTHNMHVKNGNIIQGNARSGKAIVAYAADRMVFEDLRIIMQDTPDNKGIEHGGGTYALNAGNHVVSNVHIEVPTVGVFSRDWMGGAIQFYGTAQITDSTIKTDSAGIILNPPGNSPYEEGVQISNNIIEMGFTHASMARNHYGIWVSRFTRPEISNNELTGQGQGGINLADCLEADVSYNTIDMSPRSGLRFGATRRGDRLNVAGIVIRDYGYDRGDEEYWSTRNRIHHNDVTVTVDPSKMEPESRLKAYAYWHRNRGAFDQTRCGNNFIYENTFTAINLQEDPNSFGTPSLAGAMAFEGYPPTMKDQYYNNVIQSNNLLLLAGMEETSDRGVEVYQNRMVKLDLGVTPAAVEMRPFENIYFWETGGVVIRDNTWEGGADKYDYWQNRHSGSFQAENTIIINVVDDEGNPVGNANIEIFDTFGSRVDSASGTADENGRFEGIVTDFEVFGPGSDRFYNPHTIRVTAESHDGAEVPDFTINSRTEIGVNVDDGTIICNTHHHTECYGGDLFWYDSCGIREDIAQDCGDLGCSGGACNERPECGDGAIEGSEECDDGNSNSGDGCSSSCVVESRWICSGEPSVCVRDRDSDGIPDAEDNCPNDFNPSQEDSDGDGIGDACDSGDTWYLAKRETFDTPMTLTHLQAFGDDNWLTAEIYNEGSVTISSGQARFYTPDHPDSALIRLTDNMQDEDYRIRVRLGNVDFNWEVYDDSDYENPDFTYNCVDTSTYHCRHPENGFYWIAITQIKCETGCGETWWHTHRKLNIDADDHLEGGGCGYTHTEGPECIHIRNPLYFAYFNPGNSYLRTWSGDNDRWYDDRYWMSAISFFSDRWYYAEIEKSNNQVTFSVYDSNNELLERSDPVDVDLILGMGINDETGEEYIYVGEPHTSSYEGEAYLDEIELYLKTTGECVDNDGDGCFVGDCPDGTIIDDDDTKARLHDSDDDCDGCVENSEIMNYIDRWYTDSSDVTMIELLQAIDNYKKGTGC